MPFKKTYRKRRYKKRSTKKAGWGNTALKALRLATKVAGMVNTEYKHYDYNVFATQQTMTPVSAVTLCAPPQGVAVFERTGDSIKVKNLTLRGMWSRNGFDEVVRVMVYIDKENNINTGAQMLIYNGTTNAVFSPKLDDNKYDTKILWDQEYRLTTDNPIAKFEKVIRIDRHLHFDINSATVDRNAVKMMLWTQNALSANFQCHARTTFVDN